MADSQDLTRRGLMFILSSPSGTGKTTIARKLLAVEDELRMSVSVTTRPKREGEVEGRDYFFKTPDQYAAMVAEDAFLEWAEVFGNSYGTPRAEIMHGLEQGQDFLFDVDWQGAQQLSQRARADVVSVFLLPPSMEELEHRLRSRGTDSEEVIERRMARASHEISHWDAYDYVVVNQDLDECFDKVRTILHAERLKRERQRGLIDFARSLSR
jgi:guanylate kinase